MKAKAKRLVVRDPATLSLARNPEQWIAFLEHARPHIESGKAVLVEHLSKKDRGAVRRAAASIGLNLGIRKDLGNPPQHWLVRKRLYLGK